MNIKVIETSVTYWNQYDLSEIVSDLTWETSSSSQPGKVEFLIQEDPSVFLRSGDIIEVFIDEKRIFKGKIFIRSKKKSAGWRIVAYDYLRFLKNEDTLVFGASSASARFKTICETQGLAYKILDNVPYNCPAVVADGKSYYSMLEDAIEETKLGYGGMRYGFWDNGGTLEFFSLNRQITKLVLGDESMVTDYDYSNSIDEAFNAVKVIRENKDSNSREVFAASHQGNIDKWGKLQLVETVSDADLNGQQLQQQANDLLRENNKEVKTLSLSAVGVIELRACKSFTLRMKDLEREGSSDKLCLITRCKHQLGDIHTIEMEVEMIE